MKSPMRISFEGDDAGVVIPLHACGWGYANAGCKLHAAADRCEASRVCDFFAPRDADEPPWFAVEDGLASVQGLRAELRRSPGSVCDADDSERDLAELERVLMEAPSGKFRLEIVRKVQGESPSTPAQSRS